LPAPARRNPAQATPDRRLYRPQRACSCGTRTPYAPGAPAQGRTATRSAIPVRLPAPARRNPARAVPDRRLYRPQRACSCGTRTPYAPGAPAQGRTVTRSAIPVRLPALARRNPARAAPDRRLYRPQRACSCGARTPYAPGGVVPGRGWGNAEQSAPAARNVAIARRASATESGSSAS